MEERGAKCGSGGVFSLLLLCISDLFNLARVGESKLLPAKFVCLVYLARNFLRDECKQFWGLNLWRLLRGEEIKIFVDLMRLTRLSGVSTTFETIKVSKIFFNVLKC